MSMMTPQMMVAEARIRMHSTSGMLYLSPAHNSRGSQGSGGAWSSSSQPQLTQTSHSSNPGPGSRKTQPPQRGQRFEVGVGSIARSATGAYLP